MNKLVLVVFALSCVAREAAPPQGLYLVSHFGSGGQAAVTAWFFAPDGTVEQGDQRGRVSMRGDRMTIAWDDGTKTEGDLDRNGEQFFWQETLFSRKRALTPQQLVGVWEGEGRTVTFRAGGLTDQGRWSLDGAALTLTDGSGKAVRRLALPLDANSLLFGEALYRRK